MSDIEKKPIKTKGGPRPNSGRKKGSPNKIQAEVKEYARQFGQEAIMMLAELMTTAQSEQARIAAAREILDRGYGKALQEVQADVKHSGVVAVAIDSIDRDL